MQRVTMLRWMGGFVLALVGLTSGGCAALSYVTYVLTGDNVAPEYPGLKGKKVAIVCGGEKGLSNDATSTLLTRYVELLLKKNLKDEIDIVSQDKVDKWLSERGWGEPDYEAIGKGVGADQVLAITLANMSLKNGQTLYKGRADISVSVYDVKDGGKVVYRKIFNEFEYPKMDGPSIVDTTEAKFRNLFLTIVSKHIGALFYPNDPKELAVMDPIALSF